MYKIPGNWSMQSNQNLSPDGNEINNMLIKVKSGFLLKRKPLNYLQKLTKADSNLQLILVNF